jgi:hypothetical protein
VTPAAGDKPNTVSATAVPVEEAAFRDLLARTGIGLRVAGARGGLVLRYAWLDPAAESLLLGTFGVPEASFSPAVGFGGDDTFVVNHLAGSPPEGFTLHGVASATDGRIDRLSIGVVVRPPDGALLPVIRGVVPARGTGSVLLTGEVGAKRMFVALLRLDLAGEERVGITTSPVLHHVEVLPFLLSSPALTRVLTDLGLPTGGGPGGLVAMPIDRKTAAAAAAALAREGEAAAAEEEQRGSGETLGVPFGEHRLALTSEFRLADYSYLTRVALSDLATLSPIEVPHGERQSLLVLGWDAASPGRSRVVLYRISPMPPAAR